MDTLSGKPIGHGMDAIPSKETILKQMDTLSTTPFDETRKEREMIIYRSFNLEKINR